MRIAYVCADPGVPVFGTKGCSIHVQEVIRALVHRGHDVVLIAQRVGGVPPQGLDSVTVHALPPLTAADAASREQEALAANAHVLSLLEQEGPFDLVYERYSLWSHAGVTHAVQHGLPSLLEVNAPLIDEQVAHRVLINRRGADAVATQVFASASALIAVSDEIAAYVVRMGAPATKVHVVPNGVDPERFRPDIVPARPAPAGTVTIGFVGTLKPWHGVPDLLDAFAVLHRTAPASRLLIVGSGPEQEALEQRAATLGLGDAAEFTGAVPPAEMPALVASMDIAVAPYPPMDVCYFSPLKVFEYMAAGRAVVGSRIGQLGALIEHDVDGIVYEPGSVPALAAALIRLHGDAPLRARLGAQARAKILRSHSWTATVDRLLDVASHCEAALAGGV